ncbi:protein crumbs homolog 1 [Latimeria chalumnae]|uniref:protein crumbs homolog 1 n=1 Tax=Latimeria chalumnae TaxID=7897 RepID=UPI00313BCA59
MAGKGLLYAKNGLQCLSNPCQNNATCNESADGYVCHCTSTHVHFVGKNCEKQYDACSPNPCEQKAPCISTAGSTNITCLCPPDYDGLRCERQTNKCANNTCMNGGSCYESATDATCTCVEGYTGAHCETNVNECASNPCQNGALCIDKVHGYSCFCVPGYQGKHCEIEVNECVSEPCQNGATCLNGIGKYVCVCPPGYTGTNCELEIDDCLSQPCFNSATCYDSLTGYFCTCTPGFRGNLCEINIDECASQPCQNGGKCIDKENGYSCNCTCTGFIGPHCETYIPLCLSQPCLNNATCEDSKQNYTCHCWPGFTGTQCELDINECSSNPCLRGGDCVELSWIDQYESIPELPSHFNYHQASGYICRCQQGFTGTRCQDDINECDLNPCQNGGTCENFIGTYVCHCPARKEGIIYGGQNCTDILIGCESHKCQNGGTCIPYLQNHHHGYSCICSSGYTGHLCQITTTFSFEVPGYLHVNTEVVREQFYDVTLTFRTVLPNAILFHRGSKDFFMRLELRNGQLQSTLQRNTQPMVILHSSHNVSDGEWHTVEITLERTFTLKIQDGLCTKNCVKELSIDAFSIQQISFAFQNTFIAGLPDKVAKNISYSTGNIYVESSFVGCFQDVQVDSHIIIPENLSSGSLLNISSSLNVKIGCNKNDRCEANPCQNRGHCINLWLNYHCECYRPYEGPNCSQEYIAGRFGHEDSKGYAAFLVDDDPGENITISMFVRTRKPTGLLLVLKNNTFQYLMIWLEDGKIKMQINHSRKLVGQNYINDGNFHLLSLKIHQGNVELFQSAQKIGYVSGPPVQIQAGDVVYVGGLPDQQDTIMQGGYFKGCVQDLQLNTKKMEFYPINISLNSYSNRTLINMTGGCIGDNICNKSNPCENGGVCYSNWDDFTCTCPPNTVGRTCEEVRWCELNACPPETQCQPFQNGFECIANITFKVESPVLSYHGNGKITRDLTNITFSFQTRNLEATILHAEKELEVLTIGLQKSYLIFTLQSGNSFYTLSLISTKKVSDGRWHRVTLSMTDPSSQSSRWHMEVDDEEIVTNAVTTGNLNFLKEEINIYLGGKRPEIRGGLAGCLSTVKISGIPLPFLGNADVHVTRPQREQFTKTQKSPVLIGCLDYDGCIPNPCMNGGNCEHFNNLYLCLCPMGWTGPTCEINIDECNSNPCVHGNCTDGTGEYMCDCEPGYTGTSCQQDIDDCTKNQCANGATCIDGINRYSCLCPANFTGALCEYSSLPTTSCADTKRNLTCFNGGNCTQDKGGTKCICRPGFTGDRCEIDIDECESDPCLNEGLCRNLPNRFQCICDVNFAGSRCEIDLDSDTLTSVILLSIGLSTMALLLLFFLALTAFIIAMNKRATQGTYSPSRQEKEGSRVEMWNMVQPPPMERLI